MAPPDFCLFFCICSVFGGVFREGWYCGIEVFGKNRGWDVFFLFAFLGGRCDIRQARMGMGCSLCVFVQVLRLRLGSGSLKIINWWIVLNTLHNELSTIRREDIEETTRPQRETEGEKWLVTR